MSEVTAATVDRELLKLTLRFKSDLEAYAQACLTIRGKDKVARPLIFNRAQKHIHAQLEAQKKATGKVRALILKGRQQGCSTYVGARYYHQATHGQGARVYILTHQDTATQNLFDIVKRYHDNCPDWVRPSTGNASAKELFFNKLDSGYKVGTAATKGTGRSALTITLPACCRPCPMRLAARSSSRVRRTELAAPSTACGAMPRRQETSSLRSSSPGFARTSMRGHFPSASLSTRRSRPMPGSMDCRPGAWLGGA